MRRKMRLALLASGLAIGGCGCAIAACPALPNSLTNGQVADAAQVMANFNSLANCSVVTTGTPTTGSLARFSGATSVTGGDLAGDVSTSGSLTTSLANSGVTPGTYTSANITVDAKGRITTAASGNGSGPPEASWTTPTVAGFDLIRSGTGQLTNFTESGISGVLVTAPATTANTNSLTYGVNTIPSGDHGWRLTTRIRRLTPLAQWGMMGIILRDGSSGKSVVFGLGVDSTTGINRNQFSNDTTWNSVSGVVSWYELDLWFMVYDDLTTRHISVSRDGFDWQEIYTEASNSYITPTQAGVFINPDFGAGNNISGKNPVGMKVYSLKIEAVP